MSDVKLIKNKLLEIYGSTLQTLHQSEQRRGAKISYDASINALAKQFAAPPTGRSDLSIALFTGELAGSEVYNRYLDILQGRSEASEPEILPQGQILIPTAVGKIVIGPEALLHDVGDTLAKLFTTATTKEGLPRVAEFTGEASVRGENLSFKDSLKLGGLLIKCTDFGCEVLLGNTSLGKVDLLYRYVEQVHAIEDQSAFMRTWDVYIVDYLRRAQDVVEEIGVLLAIERQHKIASGKPDDEEVLNMTIFSRALSPIVELTEAGTQAFRQSPLPRTLEKELISTQLAKLRNAMTAPGFVVDYHVSGKDAKPAIEDAQLSIANLLDPRDHLNLTYRPDEVMGSIQMDVVASKVAKMELDNPIAIRRMLDEIVYQAILHQGEESSKLSFKFDEAKRLIDVSYERPQPEALERALEDIAARHNFTGSLNFAQDETGITGLSIMDHKPEGTGRGGFGNVIGGGSPLDPSASGVMAMGLTSVMNPMMMGAAQLCGIPIAGLVI